MSSFLLCNASTWEEDPQRMLQKIALGKIAVFCFVCLAFANVFHGCALGFESQIQVQQQHALQQQSLALQERLDMLQMEMEHAKMQCREAGPRTTLTPWYAAPSTTPVTIFF